MRTLALGLCVFTLGTGCSDDEAVSSDEEARRAYLGLDLSIEKALNLGFAGYNAASSANIPDQMTTGVAGGTLTVGGQVDQGTSPNKTMRLDIGMVDYDDGDIVINEDGDTIRVVYNTSTDATMQPYLELKLNGIPTGTVSGSLTSNSAMTGVYILSGDLEGKLTIDVTITGTMMAAPTAGDILRVPGTTMVTGTATNEDGGVYEILLTI